MSEDIFRCDADKAAAFRCLCESSLIFAAEDVHLMLAAVTGHSALSGEGKVESGGRWMMAAVQHSYRRIPNRPREGQKKRVFLLGSKNFRVEKEERHNRSWDLGPCHRQVFFTNHLRMRLFEMLSIIHQ